ALRVTQFGIRQDDHKLIPTPAAHHVGTAHRVGEPESHLLEELVAPIVPIAIVDRLQAVQVEDQQAEWTPAANGRLDGFFGAAAITQSSEWIRFCQGLSSFHLLSDLAFLPTALVLRPAPFESVADGALKLARIELAFYQIIRGPCVHGFKIDF